MIHSLACRTLVSSLVGSCAGIDLVHLADNDDNRLIGSASRRPFVRHEMQMIGICDNIGDECTFIGISEVPQYGNLLFAAIKLQIHDA